MKQRETKWMLLDVNVRDYYFGLILSYIMILITWKHDEKCQTLSAFIIFIQDWNRKYRCLFRKKLSHVGVRGVIIRGEKLHRRLREHKCDFSGNKSSLQPPLGSCTVAVTYTHTVCGNMTVPQSDFYLDLRNIKKSFITNNASAQ